MTSTERAQRIVEAYAKGVICSGEVLNQFVIRFPTAKLKCLTSNCSTFVTVTAYYSDGCRPGVALRCF